MCSRIQCSPGVVVVDQRVGDGYETVSYRQLRRNASAPSHWPIH